MDHRSLSMAGDDPAGVDRAIVQAQIIGPSAEPLSPWMRLEPLQNAYDTVQFPLYSECSFDPTDDGNDENDFFDPTDPMRRYGPSSTCYPERAFVDQGDTSAPFDAENLGDADGPGLAGTSGAGTWVQPVFDLSRFRGRRIRIRLLQTGIQACVGCISHWEAIYHRNPTDRDDGWFVDDITVTDTLAEAAITSVDSEPNIDIKQDWDLDDVGATCDCAPDNADAWMLPEEAQGLHLTHSGGVEGVTSLEWMPPSDIGGTAVAYDTIRAQAPDDFIAADCLESLDPADPTSIDPVNPAPGGAYYYLIRARHDCGSGPVGETSSGTPRIARDCP
jgi:hypothetical protein